jgi:carboxyl-terminal processing protease
MQDGVKSLAAAVAVLSIAGAGAAGIVVRQKIEVGTSIPVSGRSIQLEGLLASNDGMSQMPPSEFFFKLTQLLESQYVDPISDKTVLSAGAVRGMILSLADPYSTYLDDASYEQHLQRLKGIHEGVGVELYLRYDQEEINKLQAIGDGSLTPSEPVDAFMMIPELVISSVVQGSPADLAGLQPGDRILEVNDLHLLSSLEVKKLRELTELVELGDADEDELNRIRDEFREMAESIITPTRGMEHLQTGTAGSIDIVWERGDEELTAAVDKTDLSSVPLTIVDGVIKLNLIEGAADQLEAHLADQTELNLDLRGGQIGSSEELMKVMNLLLPPGKGGFLYDAENNLKSRITIEEGSTSQLKIAVLVDETTRGPAEILATALAEYADAEVSGPDMADEMIWVETRTVMSGSKVLGGYTLAIGEYQATEEAAQ